MKLITESPMILESYVEDELNEASGVTERNYYISGIFSTPEVENRNGRTYSRMMWEREVENYQREILGRTKNSLCEYDHPPRSEVNEMLAVARIVELSFDDKGNVVGKAKILNDNTEKTNKLKGLIKEGIKIGVSSRGVGKVGHGGIVENYKLITYDIVSSPSDYNAMLDGVVEGVEFINGIAQDKEYEILENGCIGEACSIQESEEKKTNCPIQEKIDETVFKATSDIYNTLDKYLKESFDTIAKEKEVLIESISTYLEENSNTIDEEVLDIEKEENHNPKLALSEEKAKELIDRLKLVNESFKWKPIMGTDFYSDKKSGIDSMMVVDYELNDFIELEVTDTKERVIYYENPKSNQKNVKSLKFLK